MAIAGARKVRRLRAREEFVRAGSIGICVGQSCTRAGALYQEGYPRYYLVRAMERRLEHNAGRRGRAIGEVCFCEDCWSERIVERRVMFERQMNRPEKPRDDIPGHSEGWTVAVAAEEPTWSDEGKDWREECDAIAAGRADAERMLNDGGMQMSEAKLPPESVEALKREIGRYLGEGQTAVPLAVKFG